MLQMKGLACVLDGVELNVIDVTRQAPTRREEFHKVLPLRLRESAEADSHRPIAISLGRDLQRRVERAELAELSVEREVHEGLDRRIRRRPLQAALAILRRHHCLFVSQLVKNQPIGRDFRSSIQPGQPRSHSPPPPYVSKLS